MNINSQLLKIQNSKIKQFNDLAKEKNAKYYLSIGEPYFNTPVKIKKSCINFLSNNYTHYSPTNGFLDVCQKIINFENNSHHTNYNIDNIIITNGSTDGISTTLLSILNEEDEVIIFIPCYNLYRQICEFCKAKVICINTENDDFQIDYQKLRNAINYKTKAIIINSPNNPTGVCYNEESQKNIIDLMYKFNFWLLIDNVYEQINFNNNNLDKIYRNKNILERIIICQSFSKSYAMTGWRIGYIIGNNQLIKEISKLHQILTVSINSFVQKTIIDVINFNNSHMIKKYKINAKYAYERLIQMGLDVVKPKGGFYIFPSIKKFNVDSWQFCEMFLNEYKTAILPGICFELEGYVRISICTSFLVLKNALDNLEQYIKHLNSN